jgi:hypothetical protein
LKEYFADLLFQFNVKDSDKKLVISLLFEHKYNPDKYTLIQVGNYIFSQWRKEIKGKLNIKPIIPLIYYQGKKEWHVPNIRDLFSEYPDAIKQYLPAFDFIFFALNSLTKDQLNDITDAMLLIVLAGHDPTVNIKDFAERLTNIYSLKQLDEADRNFMTLIFFYKMSSTSFDEGEILRIIKTIPSPLNKDIMSTYDKIVSKSKIEGKIEVILSLYDDNIPIKQISKYTNLEEAQIIKILKDRSKLN